MDVSAKLQIKPGQRIATVGMPGDVPPIAGESAAETPEAADVVVAFVRSKAELATVAVPAIDAARRDKLGTDLNRDLLSAALAGEGVQPVRQIAIDEVWSALRFRPA